MERQFLRDIALAKLEDAEVLFQNGRYSNAYYLFGYAAEIAIKARISRLFRQDTIPDKKLVNDVYSHDLNRPVGLAGLDCGAFRQQSGFRDFRWPLVGRLQLD